MTEKESASCISPWRQWNEWYGEALKTGNRWAHNMVLCTVDESGQPHVRNVSLHKWTEDGLYFCTNSDSPKAQHLAINPHVSVCFRWIESSRQVRIEGNVSKAPKEISKELFSKMSSEEQAYFTATSQGQTHRFNQSNPLPDTKSRDARDDYIYHFCVKHKKTPFDDIPPAWSAYLLSPTYFDFLDANVAFNVRTAYSKRNSPTWQQFFLNP
eukprot:TRINITY_DN20409_c0_g1_i1.p1 TRINITY_DN20409_c0_g1~~TRINITY_DN20409_c0_g1_i1.p1  ORF type:complete len:212 (-),score=22.31 TRINITY_DN20409_c0_g1_i1:10-645(-)